VKVPFGEIIVEGDGARDILDVLEHMPSGFVEKIGELVSAKLTLPAQAQLEGIESLQRKDL